jgi:FAD/FMN-containing dehydrogenase
MATVSEIHSISTSEADVDAGATWKQLVEAAVPLGATCPCSRATSICRSVGTLAVGGISPNYRRGPQVDQVREMWVVTGTGDLERCSMHKNRDLFLACSQASASAASSCAW